MPVAIISGVDLLELLGWYRAEFPGRHRERDTINRVDGVRSR
jgi:hypothetical protein